MNYIQLQFRDVPCRHRLWTRIVLFGLVLVHASVLGAENETHHQQAPQLLQSDESIQNKNGQAEEPIAMTLRDAIRLALKYNPELTALGKEVSALEGITLQAGLLPNPDIILDMEDISARAHGPGSEFVSIRIGQLIETGGKRSARKNVAALGQESMVQTYEAKRLELIARTANLFTDVLAGQEQLRLAQSRRSLAQQMLGLAKKRVHVGKAPPIEETKSNLTLATTEIESKQAQRALMIARKQLALLWLNSEPKFEQALGNLESFVEIPEFSSLEERLSRNPLAISGKIMLEQRKASLELEEAKRIPDVTFNAGVRRFTKIADTSALVHLTIPFPIFNQNQGNIKAAHERVGSAIDESLAINFRLQNALVQAYEDLIAVQNEITMLRDEILPGAESAFNAARRGYELGKFGFLEMLDAQRTLSQNQTLHLRALTNYQYLVNEIERLIAAPIDQQSR